MRNDFPTHDDLVAYLQGRLEPDETAALDGRLADDPALRTELERTRTVLEILRQAGEEATVRRVNDYLDRAMAAGASDIHLDLTAEGGIVRLRIDGVLHEVERLDTPAAKATLMRFQQLLDLNLNEQRVPQDGRMQLTVAGKSLDVRGAFLPGIHGGRICLRILDQSNVLFAWDRLGLFPEESERLKALIRKPSGLLVVCGPTGSGKTTLLYHLVQDLAGGEINVLSIEDPVEVDLPWVAQTPLRPHLGLGYPPLIRAMMRQDPDVLMVGETRDLETLQMVVQAALTGHLLLTVMHADNAIRGVRRMLELGIEPYLLRSCLLGAVAMRLARRVCEQCAEERVLESPSLATRLGLELGQTYRAGTGCDHCRQTGYRGRTGIYEILEATAELGEAIERQDLTRLGAGGEGLLAHAARKVREGVTTPEEALRVLNVTW